MRRMTLLALCLTYAAPALAADNRAEMLVRDCLSRAGAREDDSSAPGGRRKCVFVYADDCAGKAANAQSAMQCHDDETKAWDRLLNEAYGRLKTKASSKLFAAIQVYQRGWPAYRDAMCARFHDTEEGVTGLSQSAERACLAKETALRALTLQAADDDVGRVDGYRK